MTHRITLALVFVAAAAAPAFAQVDRPDRAMHGLFGGPSRDPDSRQSLDLSLSAYGAYDTDMLGDSRTGPVDRNNQLSGIFTGVNGGLSYSHSGRSIDFGVSAGSDGRYFTDQHRFIFLGHQAGLGAAIHGRKTQVSFNASGSYRPFFGFAPFPNARGVASGLDPDLAPIDLAPPTADAIVQERVGYGYSGGAALHQTLNDRSSLSFMYAAQGMQFSHETGRYSGQSGSGSYSYRFSRDVALRLGYSYAEGRYPGLLPRLVTQTLDAGLDYSKALGATRRTTVGASFGTSAYEQSDIRSYHLVGDASLNHQIGRTWSARAVYHRGVGFLEGLNAPYFADSVSATLGGSLSRRIDLSTAFAYSNGDVGVLVRTNNFDSYIASARLRYAFTQAMAIYGEYVAYRYDFQNGVALPDGFPSATYRQGVRGGLSLYMPLIR